MDTHEILHTLTGMGSAALVAAVQYPGKMTQIPASDNEVLKSKQTVKVKTQVNAHADFTHIVPESEKASCTHSKGSVFI